MTARSVLDPVRLGLASLCLLFLGLGCQRLKPAAVPSDQKTPVVWNDNTRDVLLGMGQMDAQVLASALESNTESGSVIYIDHSGWVYNPDGTLFLDKNGNPVRVRTKVIAKLNSLKELANMQGVGKVRYKVGGFGYVCDLPEGLKGKDLCPVALDLEIDGLQAMGAVDTTAANREAAGKERQAIFDGMSKLAAAEGAAFATKVTALADGTVKVATAAGKEIVGRVLGTYYLEEVIAGAGKVVGARIGQKDGTEARVVAEGDAGAALKAAQP